MVFARLTAAGSREVENRRTVLIGFHFILMPGSHHSRQKPESSVGVALRWPRTGLRGCAAPRWRVGLVWVPRRGPWRERGGRLEHGSGVNDTPESGRRRENTEGANYRRFDRAWNSENGRTNPARIGWQDLRNLFYRLRFGEKTKTNWDLVQSEVTRG
jgi:hypothetical protein